VDPRAAGRSVEGLSNSWRPARETCLHSKQSDEFDNDDASNKNDDGDIKGKTDANETPESSTRRSLPTSAEKNTEPARDTASEGNVQKILGTLLNGLSLSFSFVTTVMGVLLSFGLLLNLFGYGYQITPERELRIDTIGQLREESQFRREVLKSMKESRQEQEQGGKLERLRELSGPSPPTK
jgi:hypothetical protein